MKNEPMTLQERLTWAERELSNFLDMIERGEREASVKQLEIVRLRRMIYEHEKRLETQLARTKPAQRRNRARSRWNNLDMVRRKTVYPR